MRKRTKIVAVYFTEEEKKRLEALAEKEERKLGQYLRRVILAAIEAGVKS